jgi:isoquinoline 1-oxidoreductase subunit beta
MPTSRPSRRDLLIAGGAGVGLVVAWRLWPRQPASLLPRGRAEHALSGFIKVAEDGTVTVGVPQVELGHGVWSGLAQVAADELGADWSRVAVTGITAGAPTENALLSREWPEWSDLEAATGWSTSVPAYEARMRDAGAAARTLLRMAAAERWQVDRQACETRDGLVLSEGRRLPFGALATLAATQPLPAEIPWRDDHQGRLTPASLPRLDLPPKVDGSLQFAGDIRLPDMVFASVIEGPLGDARFVGFAGHAGAGFASRATVTTDRWASAIGRSWWEADQLLGRLRPRFEHKEMSSTATSERAVEVAFEADATTVFERRSSGDPTSGRALSARYSVGALPSAPLETAAATARLERGTVELWTATQLPALARTAVAQAAEVAEDRVVLHPVMAGGSFGARADVGLAGIAGELARTLGRPVQVMRSRTEEQRRVPPSPAGRARMSATLVAGGQVTGWHAQLACPRLGALDFPYAVPSVAVDHYESKASLPLGDYRGRWHILDTFAREAFTDELANAAGLDPFSFRIGLLGGNVRLARCLTRVADLGGWQGGGAGSSQGIALHSAHGSAIAVLAEARLEAGRVRVERLVAVADVGRVINPDIVRSQIIGGLVFGMSAATCAAVTIENGIMAPTRLGALRLPRMADCPPILVELIASGEAPGGVGELAVPPVPPAIAGALFAATGTRYRQLPFPASP